MKIAKTLPDGKVIYDEGAPGKPCNYCCDNRVCYSNQTQMVEV